MIKSLIVIRHAKSSWADHQASDFDRGLKQRGRDDAELIRAELSKLKIKPDIIAQSPALRTEETRLILAQDWGAPVIKDERIYLASLADLYQVIADFDDGRKNAAIIGHNPGLTELINDASHTRLDNLPTSGVAIISFDTKHWASIAKLQGSLSYFITPAQLRR